MADISVRSGLATARLFERLFESSPDGIVLTDRQGRIVRVNGQAESMFGYPREELLGQPVELLAAGAFQVQPRRLFGQTLHSLGAFCGGSWRPQDRDHTLPRREREDAALDGTCEARARRPHAFDHAQVPVGPDHRGVRNVRRPPGRRDQGGREAVRSRTALKRSLRFKATEPPHHGAL